MQTIFLLDEGSWPQKAWRLLRRRAPHSLIVRMIHSPRWGDSLDSHAPDPRIRYLVKTDFSRSLLPLLEEMERCESP
jgi:hypothetical protein